MYKRARKKTERVIRNALLELIKDHSIDDITVLDLCEAAEINRSTFYAYYDNLPQLIDSVLIDAVDDLISCTIYSQVNSDMHANLKNACDLVSSNPVKYQLLFNSKYNKNALDRFTDAGIRYWIPRLKKNMLPKEAVEMISYFTSAGYLSMMRYWLLNSDHLDQNEFYELFHGLVLNGLHDLLPPD